MKKLMIALAAVAMAAGVQAAQWTWGVSPLAPVYEPGYTADDQFLSSGNAYLYAYQSAAAAKEAISAFVDAYAAGELVQSGYKATQSISDGMLSSNVDLDDPWSGMTKGTKAYWAMLIETNVDGKDYLFVDYMEVARLADGKGKTFLYMEDENSANVFEAASGAYAANGNGYYTAVPEPTSGLLLLLGVAGLALKRKRA